MTSPAVPAACAARFKPERKIAEGGFGSVWYATQVELMRPVALKILHPELVLEQEQVQRFMTEARVTASLRHPNVVTLIDHGVEDGVPWIAYEFVTGESLRARLARGPLPWREACEVAAQVAAALEAAHAQGVLHRDIKPDNILSAEAGHYKVADFGIAKVRAGEALTARGVILGTPSYLSPVQIRGEAPGPDSDVYALGITLYELLTGQPPFAGETPLDTLSEHLTAEVPHARQAVPDVPAELDELLVKMLAKSRAERMGNAAEVRASLTRLIAAPQPPPVALGSGRARRPRPGGSDTLPSGVAPMPGAPIRPPIARRGSWPVALAGGALLVAALLWHRPVPDPRPSPSVVTLAPVEIPDLRAEPLAHKVRVSLLRPPGERLAVEIGRGEPPVWETRVTIDGEGEFQARDIDQLEPDTPYHVRVRALDRPGETPPVFVRTLRVLEERATPDPTLFDRRDRAAPRAYLLEVLPVSAPDQRLVSFLIRDMQEPPAPSTTYLHAILSYAWRTPSRSLVEALFKLQTANELRAGIVGLACYVGLPGAREAAVDLMARAEPKTLLPLFRELEHARLPELFDATEAFVRSNVLKLGTPAVTALAAMNPERARAVFEDWLCEPGDDKAPKRTLGALGFGALPGPRTLAQLERIARRVPQHAEDLLLALSFHRLDPEAVRIARTLQVASSLRAQYYAAVLGIGDVPTLLGLLDGPERSVRDIALRALVALPPGSMPPALIDRADVADLAAFSYAGVTDPAKLAVLRARALSDRDRSGMALWALARCKDPAAGPRALEILARPAGDDPQAAGRLALAAWAAGDLLLADAKAPLERLAATKPAPFTRTCVTDALAWIAAGRAPLSLMLPWGLVYVPTGIRMRRLETVLFESSELPPPGARQPEPDVADLQGYLNPTMAYVGVGPSLEDVKGRARTIGVDCDGELALSRAMSLGGAFGHVETQNLVRLVIQR